MEWLAALFTSISQALILATKLAPNEKIQEDNHVIKREGLIESERQLKLTNALIFLDFHLRLHIDKYVDIKFHDLQPEDREYIRAALHQMRPKRK